MTFTALLVVVVLSISGRASFAQPLAAGSEFRVNSGTEGDQSNPRVAVDAQGNFLVVWAGDGVAAQRFDSAGGRRGGELPISAAASDVDVGMNGAGDFVAAWADTLSGYLNVGRFGPNGAARGDAFRLEGHGHDGIAVETARDGSFVVAWSDYGFGYGNFALERFGPGGRSQGALRDHSGSYPSMVMNAAGDFMLVRGFRSLSGQRYESAGNSVGPSFRVDSDESAIASKSAIAQARDGSFVVAWQARKQSGLVIDVHARRFDANGVLLGDDVQVNTHAGAPFFDRDPDVAIARDGSSLVVWSSRGQDGDEGGVFGRRLDGAGQPLGIEFQINSFTMLEQGAPAVAFDARGNAVVAWHSFDQDGSGYGIFARRYLADGGSLAPDVVIHPTAQLGANPTIGRGTVIGQGVVIGDDAVIGEEVRLERQARAGHRVALGDRVTVGSRAAIGNDVAVGADTRIDLGATLGDAAAIGDGVTIGRNAVVGPRAAIGPLVVLDIGARVGRGATVEMGARVGRRAVVRPGAVVPAGTTVAPGVTFP